jgi:hypothetical protein
MAPSVFRDDEQAIKKLLRNRMIVDKIAIAAV